MDGLPKMAHREQCFWHQMISYTQSNSWLVSWMQFSTNDHNFLVTLAALKARRRCHCWNGQIGIVFWCFFFIVLFVFFISLLGGNIYISISNSSSLHLCQTGMSQDSIQPSIKQSIYLKMNIRWDSSLITISPLGVFSPCWL